jgi:hypothetical protein
MSFYGDVWNDGDGPNDYGRSVLFCGVYGGRNDYGHDERVYDVS